MDYYLLECDDHTIERIWHYCNYTGKDIAMYRTRITQHQIGWVVELDPGSPLTSLFLLQWSQYITHISAPYYV